MTPTIKDVLSGFSSCRSVRQTETCKYCGRKFYPDESDYENCCSDDCYVQFKQGEDEIIDCGDGDYMTRNEYDAAIKRYWDKKEKGMDNV